MRTSRPFFSQSLIRGVSVLLLSLLSAVTLAVSAQAAPPPPSNPVPYVDIVSPVSITPGSTGNTLTVRGTGFVSGSSTVYWNGVALATTFVSAKLLTATVPNGLVATQGFGSVTVVTIAPGGGTSNVSYVPVSEHLLASNFPATPSSTVTVGGNPVGIATADFNGDGKVDLAVANGADTTISILLNNGDGTFTASPAIQAGANPNWIVAGDFNGDGKVDLAVADVSGNNVTLLLGNGDGTFTLKSAPSTGVAPYAVVAGDFNGDGKLDLATANGDSTVSILLGNGDGTFTAGTPATASSFPGQLVLGDFNEDGILDIAVVNNGDSTISMLLGNGDGTFQAPISTSVGGSGAGVGIMAADFNGDGHLDVATVNFTDTQIFLGDGTGALTPGTTPAAGSSLFLGATGDFNGDGKLDMVVSDSNVGGFLFPGNGDGTFVNPVNQFTSAVGLYGAAVADFNGDGSLDVAFTDSVTPGTVDIVLQVLPVSLAPTSLAFGNQGINTPATKTLTLTNNSPSTVTISSMVIAGANAGDFTRTATTCGATVLSAATCTISIKFIPTTLLAETAHLTVTDDADGSPQILALSGTGVIFPQTIAKSFGAASIALNGSTSLSFTITNPNAGSTLTNLAFTDTLPAGLTVSTPNGATGTCGGGTITATAGSGSVTLSGATLALSGTCTFSVNVTGTTAGLKTNTVSSTSTEGGTSLTSTASVTVITAPVLTKAFGAASISLNASTSLTFTVTNSNGSTSLTGAAFTDTFPAGMVVSTPNGLTGTCGGGTITATAGAGSVALSGATIAAAGSCTFSVNVTGTGAGTLVNTTSTITSTNGGTGIAATASLSVLAPDLTITKTHTGNFQQGQTGAVYTISVTNAGNGSTAGLVTVVDTLPSGLTATALSGSGWTCTVLTATCTRADALAAGGSYPPLTLTVTVSGTAAASLTNSVTVSGGGETNLANDTATNPTTIVSVTPDFSITAAPSSRTVTAGTNANYTLTITPLNNVPFNTAITLTASGLPTEATAEFQTSPVTPGSTVTTDPMTITTSSGAFMANNRLRPAQLFAFGMPLAGIFLVGLGSRKRKSAGRSSMWMVLIVLCTGFALWGCANGPKGTPTPAGTYTITVTAVGGTTTHTTSVSLIVQ